jgi:CheY-like chemotaxis protein
MTDELFSLRVVVISDSPDDHDLYRQAASASTMPIEIIEAESAAAARRLVIDEVDLVLLDTALTADEIAQVVDAARGASKPPFTVLLSASTAGQPLKSDALAAKPNNLTEAKRLMESSIRVRLPSRVLVVDDSATMRSIVKKILAATRFPLEVSEVGQGFEAIELARKTAFDIVFLDYNLPGFSGLETMAEFLREKRRPTFVLMTSTPDEAIAGRARAHGAAFLKKPFFPADIEAVLCSFYGLRALNPQRL